MRIGKAFASTCVFCLSLLLLLPERVFALPTEGEVIAGSAVIGRPTGGNLHVEQITERAILQWRNFDIAADKLVEFRQPSAGSVALNRIWGGEPSVILGQLRANGRVFLMNPNGILFGAGAEVNVAGLAATTLPIGDSDFMNEQYLFQQDPAQALGSGDQPWANPSFGSGICRARGARSGE